MACIICFDIVIYALFSSFRLLCVSSHLLHSTLRFEPTGGSIVASQKIMRLGVMRINAGLLLGAMDCPPSGSAWACPRISRLRVFHGGCTSSTNKDTRPLQAILRNFCVLAMSYPPISMESNSGL